MKKVVIVVVLIFSALLFQQILHSQTMPELKNEKSKLQSEIQFTENLLEEIGAKTRASLAQLNVLAEQIHTREKIVDTYNSELYKINQQAEAITDTVQLLEEELNKLKSEYANLIYSTYVNRSTTNVLLYVVSAESVTQSYRRFQYLSQYARLRHIQAMEVKTKKQELNYALERLRISKKEKEELIALRHKEMQRLNSERIQQKNLTETLELQAVQLKNNLQLKTEEMKILETKISNSIVISMQTDSLENPEELDFVSQKFFSMKGMLPWPVYQGVVTSYFGLQQHEILSGVNVMNNGIEITTNAETFVRAIAEGVVNEVITIPNKGKAVLIAHGNYFTLYSNIDNLRCKKDDKMKATQIIGTVYSGEQQAESILSFQIWYKQQKLNPLEWLLPQN